MSRSVIGILAHVDSGKTTLSEAVLYLSGKIRTLGRVDRRSSFLDNNSIERQRGITVFSKQAEFAVGDRSFTLIDTPGHVDFSSETERTLAILDAAIMVVSGSECVQSHTETLWKLLEQYNVPTFIFVNKMDMDGADTNIALADINRRLSSRCVDFSGDFSENAAMCDEELMEKFLADGDISAEDIAEAVKNRRIFPCVFGSALKVEGVDRLLECLEKYAPACGDNGSFGARVFKIADDPSAGRLTYMKITGGTIKVREPVTYLSNNGEEIVEKAAAIRIYSGAKFRLADTADAGTVCAVVGFTRTFAGQGLGSEDNSPPPQLEPVLVYRAIPPEGVDCHTLFTMLHTLEEEEPQLRVMWDTTTSEIKVSLMGDVQLEILKALISERFGIDVEFSQGSVSYKETIAAPVMGAGHYEPLRHYAEVHLRLEPVSRGEGLIFDTHCSEDILDRNWQRLILTHLAEKNHKGALTGSPITDMKITLVTGRAHLKHTEGGDFRQATYRAVRQGLRKAQGVLLEPWYDFRLEVPSECVGRAMSDIQSMSGSFDPPEVFGELSLLTGSVPVSEIRNYHSQVMSYSKGRGRLSLTLCGYRPCHNAQQVIEDIGYDADSDIENTADSVFCSHGAGFNVRWDSSDEYMHLSPESEDDTSEDMRYQAEDFCRRAAEDKELMEIFERTYGKIERDKRYAMKTPKDVNYKRSEKLRRAEQGKEYLLVDGYNIIFAWEELRRLADKSMDLARSSLINTLCSYQGFKQCEVILVFDAYKVKDRSREVERHYNIDVIYTKEAETADTYIEKAAHKLSSVGKVRVATSDGMEQIIIMGNGAYRMSAEDLRLDVENVKKAIQEFLGSK